MSDELFEALDHVGIAVPSLEEGLALYGGIFGMQVELRQDLPEQGTAVLLFRCGGARIELLAPLRPDSPVGIFLAERGAGIHHTAYRVRDLIWALERCRNAGLQVVDEVPRVGAGAHRVAFLHPRSTGRTLIELVARD